VLSLKMPPFVVFAVVLFWVFLFIYPKGGHRFRMFSSGNSFPPGPVAPMADIVFSFAGLESSAAERNHFLRGKGEGGHTQGPNTLCDMLSIITPYAAHAHTQQDPPAQAVRVRADQESPPRTRDAIYMFATLFCLHEQSKAM
jgi:hypothetical protein